MTGDGPFTEYENHSLIASTNIWACLKGVTPTYRKSQPSVSLLKKRPWGQVKVWATVPKIQEVSTGSRATGPETHSKSETFILKCWPKIYCRLPLPETKLLSTGSVWPQSTLLCKEDPIYVFPEIKRRGLVRSNFQIHVNVSNLYIPSICCSKKDR